MFQVVLCGGSARIPRLQQMIKDLFADVELLSSAPPDEVIAVGAAMEAGLLVGREIGSSPESVTVEACVSDILLKVHRHTHTHTHRSVTNRVASDWLICVIDRRWMKQGLKCSLCSSPRARPFLLGDITSCLVLAAWHPSVWSFTRKPQRSQRDWPRYVNTHTQPLHQRTNRSLLSADCSERPGDQRGQP